MLPLPNPARSLRLFSAIIAAVSCSTAFGQTPSTPTDGFTQQERPGIAMVKPQTWSKDTETTVMEFLAFYDRTVKGAVGAGYYEFKTKSSDKRQVPAAKISKLVVYPDTKDFQEILTPEAKDALVKELQELKEVSVKFPASKTYLDPYVKALTAEIAEFDGGKVKVSGKWIEKDIYFKQQATKLADLLNAEVVRAKPPSSFDLRTDPKFTALEALGGSNPEARKVASEIAARYDKLVRAERRLALLEKLNNPELPLPEARGAVAQLKTLKPEEDPRSESFVKSWDSASATLGATTEVAAKLAASLETEMAAVKTEDAVPQLSPELEKSIKDLDGTVSVFVASKPPSQLLREGRQAIAVCAIGKDFGRLNKIFEEKQFLQAKDILEQTSRQAHQVGPQTAKVVTGLLRISGDRIGEFSRLREEAKLLDDSNKTAEALAKYEAAFAVIPDKGVGEQIARLKPAAAPATP